MITLSPELELSLWKQDQARRIRSTAQQVLAQGNATGGVRLQLATVVRLAAVQLDRLSQRLAEIPASEESERIYPTASYR